MIAATAVPRLFDPQPIDEIGLLEADGRHLLTDVWTSAGVLIAVVLVVLTGWNALDPLIALAVAANIVFTGSSLVRLGIDFHAIRTRQAGSRAFISLHVLVPGAWTVQRGHDTVEEIEDNLRRALPHATIFTHLEPVEDPRSLADVGLERSHAEI